MFFFYRCFGFFLGYFRKVDEIDMKIILELMITKKFIAAFEGG